jgi:hypothetical protein
MLYAFRKPFVIFCFCELELDIYRCAAYRYPYEQGDSGLQRHNDDTTLWSEGDKPDDVFAENSD